MAECGNARPKQETGRMSASRKQELAAIEAVARHFSATWEKGKGPHDAFLVVGGKRVAVEVTAIKRRIAGLDRFPKPRLRFDKVALRVVSALQASLGEVVPEGETAIVTITAPIRLASKTTAAVEDKIRDCLARRSARFEVKDTIHGNQVRIRLVKGVSSQAPKVIGFVHNPDPGAGILLDMTQSLLEGIGAPARFAVDRWLVLAMEDEPSHFETYQQVYSQLSMPTEFKKILMVFSGGLRASGGRIQRRAGRELRPTAARRLPARRRG